MTYQLLLKIVFASLLFACLSQSEEESVAATTLEELTWELLADLENKSERRELLNSITCREGHRRRRNKDCGNCKTCVHRRRRQCKTCSVGQYLTGCDREEEQDGTCATHECSALSVSNGQVSYTDPAGPFGQRQEKSVATFSCNTGYFKSGNSKRICESDKWTGSNFSCVAQTCSKLSVSNGLISYSDPSGSFGQRQHGSVATHSCNTGYTLSGNSKRTCSSGKWNGSDPKCVPDCPYLSIANGRVTYSDPSGSFGQRQEGSVARVTCASGYELNGSSERRCQSGKWTGSDPTCEGCNVPPVLNSVIDRHCSQAIGSTCQLRCGAGFEQSGNADYTCNKDRYSGAKKWEGGSLICRGCGPVISNLEDKESVSYECPDFKVGAKCTVFCKEQRRYYGKPRVFECNQNSMWVPVGRAIRCGLVEETAGKLLQGVLFNGDSTSMNVFSLDKEEFQMCEKDGVDYICPYWMSKPNTDDIESEYVFNAEEIDSFESFASDVGTSNAVKFDISGSYKGAKAGLFVDNSGSTKKVYDWFKKEKISMLELRNEHPLFRTRLDLDEVSLSANFVKRVNALPRWSEDRLFSFINFFELFGTHVYQKVTFGGTFRVYQAFGTCDIEESNIDLTSEKECFKVTLGLKQAGKGGKAPVSGDASLNPCTTETTQFLESSGFKGYKNRREAYIKGGDARAQSAFKDAFRKAGNDVASVPWDDWENSVKEHPAAIDFTTTPIWQVLSVRGEDYDIEDYLTKVEDIQQAFEAYLKKWADEQGQTYPEIQGVGCAGRNTVPAFQLLLMVVALVTRF